jgi:3-methyladenine DNA glycosylase/8-oxoguanine DNA glycosylase
VLVRLPEPYDFELSTERFRAFGRDPVNVWEEGRLYRVLDGAEVALAAAPRGVRVEPRDVGRRDAIRRFLGASFDLDGFIAFARVSDPVLARIVAGLPGLRPLLIPDPFEMLVGSITAQQVSLYAAGAIRARLVERYGRRVDHAYSFPRPEDVARASPEDLTALGFSRRKAEYTLALARSDLDLDALAVRPDEDVKRTLTALPGLGEWTADWFLARHLGRPDAWPAGDLGLRKAVAAFYFDGRAASADDVRAFGARFSPFRNLAAQYLLVALRVLRR